jgi:hypothetical protein
MKKLAAALTLVFYGFAHAQQNPIDLAIETYKFLETNELKLQSAINGGSKADYDKFIWMPTLEQLRKWPKLDNEAYSKYTSCRLAVDSFRVYSEDQFKVGGKMDKSRPFYRDYFGKKKECAALLKGKV